MVNGLVIVDSVERSVSGTSGFSTVLLSEEDGGEAVGGTGLETGTTGGSASTGGLTLPTCSKCGPT